VRPGIPLITTGCCHPLGELGSLRMRGMGIVNTVCRVVYQTNMLHIYSLYSYIHLEHLKLSYVHNFLPVPPSYLSNLNIILTK
jgi:hypothetical protein